MTKEPWFFERFVSRASDMVGDSESLSSLLERAKEKAERNRSAFGAALETLFAFIRLIRAWVKGEYRDVSTKTIVLLVAAVIYFLNPLDAVPDFLPLIGFGDDVVFIFYVLGNIKEELEKFLEWERSRKSQD